MKRIFLILFFCLFTSQVFSAELLVRAKPHWKDSWSQQYVNSLSAAEKEQYDTRTQREDIIVVRPDGWVWGSEECLPNFVVIKIPGMSYETAKQYEGSLMDSETGKLKKVKKWHIDKQIIDDAVAAGQSVITLTESDFNIKKLEKTKKVNVTIDNNG